MSPKQTQLALTLLWRLAWVVAFLVLARVLLWSMSWYSVRAALAFGATFYGVQRLRTSRPVLRLRSTLLGSKQPTTRG